MPAEVPVESVDWAAYRIPTDAPEADGTFAWDATTMVVVHARAGGETGLGWTYGAAAAGHLIDEVLASVVCGRSALDVTAAYHAMHRAVRNLGRPGVAGTAISAVDVALWDLKARLFGVRLARLLGAVHRAVAVYGSGGFTSYDDRQLTDQLSGWVKGQGIPRVKIKIGESWGGAVSRDLARIALARQVIGDEAELFVDANGGYRRKQAMRVADRMADHGVSWFEEPVSSDDLDGLRVAALAAAHNLDVSAHCAPHVHVDAALATPNVRHLEWFHDHVCIESTYFDGALDPAGGVVRPDLSAPGHGLTFKERDAQRYRT